MLSLREEQPTNIKNCSQLFQPIKDVSRDRFHQHVYPQLLRAAFTRKDPQSIKIQSSQVSFCAFGIFACKNVDEIGTSKIAPNFTSKHNLKLNSTFMPYPRCRVPVRRA